MTTVLDGHITIDDSGVARIAGTRIKVMHLVMDKMANGSTPEQMHEQFPHLSLAQIHAAMTYYYDHRADVNRQIQEDAESADRLRAEAGESRFAKRMRDSGKLPIQINGGQLHGAS